MGMEKPPRSFRIDPDLLDRAAAQGVDVTQIFEAALAKAVKDKRCPYCNQRIQTKVGGKKR